MEEDPFSKLEGYLAKASAATHMQVEAWQKLHQLTHSAHELTKAFNVERTHIPPSGEYTSFNTNFAAVSGEHLLNIASKLVEPDDVKAATGTSNVLLSGLQSNIAAYVEAHPYPIGFKLFKTEALLKAQQVPLEDRTAQLRRRLVPYSDHFGTMLDGVGQDLMNSTNPLSLSNAAKNLRELLTAFLHQVSPDRMIMSWPDVELDDGRPTRRSRLNYFVYMRAAINAWPQKWRESVSDLVADLLKVFGALNKFTHINESTRKSLAHARLELDRFCDRFINYLEARNKAPDVLVDVLEATVSDSIQDCVENDLLPGLESQVSHVYGPQVEDVNLTIEETGDSYFRLSGGFAMTATYQIGSDGDVRRGDGLEWEETKHGRYVGRADLEDLAITIDECEVDSDDHHDDVDLADEVSLENKAE